MECWIMGKNLYYCKIDGTIYNFKEVQVLLQQNKQWDAIQKIKEIAIHICFFGKNGYNSNSYVSISWR